MREDFLVRFGDKRRAVHVVLPYNANGCPYSDILSEFELFWLLCFVADAASKLHWKTCSIDIYGSNAVTVRNCAGHVVQIGYFDEIVEVDHFLNDQYYCPKGFYIK